MSESSPNSSTLQDDVPREYDSIQVLFELPSVGTVWWPTTVLSSREHPNPGVVKGTGTVEFSCFQKYKKSVEDVQFLGNRLMCTAAGETSWRTSAEAADAGEGDNMEADWEHNKCTRAQGVSVEARCSGDETVEEGNEPAQVDHDGQTKERGVKRRRQKNTTNVRTSAMRYPELSVSTAVVNEASGKVNAEAVEYLARRVSVLETRSNDEADRAVKAFIRNFVQDNKELWKTSLLEALRSAVRQPKPTRVEPFGAVIRSDCMTISQKFTFQWFSFIVDDVATTMGTKNPRVVQFVPSLAELMNPMADLSEGHILFDSARALLNWFGVTLNKDVKAMTQKWKK